MLAIVAASVGFALPVANAQDATYDQFDLLMFFRNPNGGNGTTQVVTFSLGSTTAVFREAADPMSSNYGTTMFLGNVNSALTGNYGTNWSSLSANSTIFAGAVGASNTLTTNLDTGLENDDWARTVYFSRKRTSAGTAGSPNSSNFTLPSGATAQSNIASNIDGANNVALSESNPFAVDNGSTVFDSLNPINVSNVAGTAFTGITSGVAGRLLTTSAYSLGTATNIVVGLDLYRGTPLANQTGSWEEVNGITGVSDRVGYYLGTITLSLNGDVNFVAVPEPSTALLALGGAFTAAFFSRRRRQTSTVQ